MQVRLFLARATRRCTTWLPGLTGVQWEEAGSVVVAIAMLGANPSSLACKGRDRRCEGCCNVLLLRCETQQWQ